ncbi:glycosyltransferase 87 family protein [Austwickia chelonae]|uniref:glycosyltransferase 87 family protein n=1 Tax=Austwickia chelonae TaxID=100225 RepID=UPI0013C30E54|nr:glycosyltransferase 87 family protein [Austwickia chelonae]
MAAVWATGGMTLVLSFFLLWLFGQPEDLGVYRSASALALNGQDRLYDTGSDVLPYTYPPIAAYLLAPVTLLPAPMAAVLVILLNLLFLWRITWIFLGTGPAVAVLLLPLARLVEPIWQTFSFGQVNLLLAWLIAEDLLNGRRRRWAGILLGLAILVKLTPAAFLLLPLVRRDLAALARSFLTVCAGVAAGFLLLPASSATYWVGLLGASARVGGPDYIANQSLAGAMARAGIGTQTGTGPVWALLCFVVVTMATIAVRRAVQDDRDRHAVLAAAFCALLISPISWSHHWVWVWPMLLLWCSGALSRVTAASVEQVQPWPSEHLHSDTSKSRTFTEHASEAISLVKRMCSAVNRSSSDRVARALAFTWAIVTISHLLWWAFPARGTWSSLPIWQLVFTSVYTGLGAATLAWCAFHVDPVLERSAETSAS